MPTWWRRSDVARKTTTGDRELNQAIRDWARNQGHQVSERGRIPQDLVVAFKEAQPA
ncbi:Lsr2 family DNA-binding protein [Actinosynnema sp. CS-041913]|uniref:Lsr2 family DNA-binding protein n=1 Tax=Actinosynnema sp. CS-041913 TaxID=3239917 RepID=UPI003D89D449